MPADVDSPAAGSPKKPERSLGAVAALVFVVATVPLLLYAARNGPDRDDRAHDPLELSDDNELRGAAVAISGVIQAAPDDENRAIQALEALHPRSPGAADLRDSCVTTYRGAHDAQQILAELRTLLPADGGAPTDAQRLRLNEMLDRSQRLTNEARDVHLRCIALYEQACQRLHVTPAHRPNH